MVDGVRIYLHAKKTLRKWIIKKFGGSGYFKNHGKSSKIFQGFSVQSMEYCISCYYWQHYAYHWNWNFIIACSSYVYMRLTQHAMQFRTQSILLSSKLFTLNLLYLCFQLLRQDILACFELWIAPLTDYIRQRVIIDNNQGCFTCFPVLDICIYSIMYALISNYLASFLCYFLIVQKFCSYCWFVALVSLST